jgi:aspartate/methionine/tyrosine aminotransferase
MMATEARAAADEAYDGGKDEKQARGQCRHDLRSVMDELVAAAAMTNLAAVPEADRAFYLFVVLLATSGRRQVELTRGVVATDELVTFDLAKGGAADFEVELHVPPAV